jgi:hypothetical protein
MKKVVLSVAFLIVAAGAVLAQEYKNVKVGIGLGYAMPSGQGAKAGVLFYLEPAYRVSDPLLVGLRLESALVARGYTQDVASVDLEVAGIGSYSAFAQYYFLNGTFRPYVGGGLGIFTLAAVSASTRQGSPTTAAVEAGSKFGFFPRVGFDLGHFNMSLDYNLIPASASTGVGGDIKNSYVGFRAGFSIGGGKK